MISIESNETIEIEIKKSKFIGLCFYVKNLQQINEILSDLKSRHSKATHICYGYVLGSNKEKFSDDGEPTYTAGKPILDVIKKQQLSNVIVVVVRYFGGVKLGAGGLIRAYSKAASEVLKISNKTELKKFDVFKIVLNYEQHKNILNEININKDIMLINIEFLDNVILHVGIAENLSDCICEKFSQNYKLININLVETKYFKL